MQILALALILIVVINSNRAVAESQQVSGCVLLVGVKGSIEDEAASKLQRIVVREAFQEGKIQSGQGRARFSAGDKKWDLNASFVFEEQNEGKFDGTLAISLNGLSVSIGPRVHINSVSYVENYFIPENGELKVLRMGEEALQKAALAPFYIFSFCTPKFSESKRQDTIYL